ncbi:putative beta-1,3-galactosyltransferase 19 [Sesbania bispinosa]|nr:putative beta-1,3-galactosyltransferase 19 [Sesbania bispinosa]
MLTRRVGGVDAVHVDSDSRWWLGGITFDTEVYKSMCRVRKKVWEEFESGDLGIVTAKPENRFKSRRSIFGVWVGVF